jgi:hypothetical protein
MQPKWPSFERSLPNGKCQQKNGTVNGNLLTIRVGPCAEEEEGKENAEKWKLQKAI